MIQSVSADLSAAVAPVAHLPGSTRSRDARPLSISPLDRTWSGHWTGAVVTPIEMPSLPEVRALWRRAIDENPTMPFACRIDDRSQAWITVPERDRDAFVRATVVPIDDPEPDEADSFLARSMEVLPDGHSTRIGVGRQSLLVLNSHMTGDAATTSSLIRALIDLDDAGIAALAHRADMRTISTTARALARTNGRAWLKTAFGRFGGNGRDKVDAALVPTTEAPSTPARAQYPRDDEPARPQPGFDDTPAPTPPRIPDGSRTQVVSVRWSNADLRQVTRWRNQQPEKVSLTTVLTALTHRTLVGHGLPLEPDGFYSLYDMRRYLPNPAKGVLLAGNLAKSVRVSADMTNLDDVHRAGLEVIESGRPVISTLIGAVANTISRWPRPRRHGATAVDDSSTVAMTFNSMPALPGLSGLPWLPGSVRQYVGVGYPAGPGSITVFAMRLREHMQVTAVFPESLIAIDDMRRALTEIPTAVERLSPPAVS